MKADTGKAANDQAYRLFTLALAGHPEKGAMNRLRETPDIPRLAHWLLAASYAVTGRPEVARELLDMRDISTEPEYYYYYYGSAIRDKAIILYTLAILKDEEQALPVLKEICDKFNSDSWYSTQSVAWGLLAYMKWSEMLPPGNDGPAKVTMTLNGEKQNRQLSPIRPGQKHLR